jgi:hypothetical protein
LGDLDESGRQENTEGFRILSAYTQPRTKEKLWLLLKLIVPLRRGNLNQFAGKPVRVFVVWTPVLPRDWIAFSGR